MKALGLDNASLILNFTKAALLFITYCCSLAAFGQLAILLTPKFFTMLSFFSPTSHLCDSVTQKNLPDLLTSPRRHSTSCNYCFSSMAISLWGLKVPNYSLFVKL